MGQWNTRMCLGAVLFLYFTSVAVHSSSCNPGWTGNGCNITCSRGWYGANCTRKCMCFHGSCSPTHGTCQCDPGYKLPFCAEICDPGTYGRSCLYLCNCEGQKCDPRTGSCSCGPGLTGEKCEQHCSHGTFGQNCSKLCSCQQNAGCDGITGTCNCPLGYVGQTCQDKCAQWKFGHNCSQTCPCVQANTDNCDIATGTCQCKPGFKGSNCSIPCTCSGGTPCDPSGNCTCPKGFWGPRCTHLCDCFHGCCKSQSGLCVCDPGWTGIKCETPFTQVSGSVLKNSVHLQCLPNRFIVTLDFSKLSIIPADFPNIHLGPTCTGAVKGDHLIFNVSYDLCHTNKTVEKDQILFKNSIWYAPLSTDNVIRDVQWIDDIICSHPLHGTDSVHIYPKHNTTSHVTTSGQIQGAPVHISLYKDASFQTLFIETKDKAVVGQPVYVQVAAPSSHSLILIVNYCHAHLTSDPGNSVSHPLISQGCPVDIKTQILATRNLLTRFQFEMFTLPQEDDGIYVTCDVTFCSTMDFSPHCQLGCHTNQHPNIVGK